MAGSLNAAPKPIFRGMVIATAGDLGPKFTNENLARWIANFGGRYSLDFDESVTHLIATDEQFKKNVSRVRQAKKSLKSQVKVVTPDWVDMSMFHNKKEDVGKYSHLRKQKEENAKKRLLEKEAKGLKEGMTGINSTKYHVYSDTTFFEYQIMLNRDPERMRLTIFESDAKPHLYNSEVRYWKRRNVPAKAMRLSDVDGGLTRELENFGKVFARKTGIPWDHRLKWMDPKTGIVTGPPNEERQWYSYQIPKRGKPVGLVKGQAVEPPCFEEENAPVPAGQPLQPTDISNATPSHATTVSAKLGRPSLDTNNTILTKGEPCPKDPAVREAAAPAVDSPHGETSHSDFDIVMTDTTARTSPPGALNWAPPQPPAQDHQEMPPKHRKPSLATAAIAARRAALLEKKARDNNNNNNNVSAGGASTGPTGDAPTTPSGTTPAATPSISPPRPASPTTARSDPASLDAAMARAGPAPWRQTSIASHVAPRPPAAASCSSSSWPPSSSSPSARPPAPACAPPRPPALAAREARLMAAKRGEADREGDGGGVDDGGGGGGRRRRTKPRAGVRGPGFADAGTAAAAAADAASAAAMTWRPGAGAANAARRGGWAGEDEDVLMTSGSDSGLGSDSGSGSDSDAGDVLVDKVAGIEALMGNAPDGSTPGVEGVEGGGAVDTEMADAEAGQESMADTMALAGGGARPILPGHGCDAHPGAGDGRGAAAIFSSNEEDEGYCSL